MGIPAHLGKGDGGSAGYRNLRDRQEVVNKKTFAGRLTQLLEPKRTRCLLRLPEAGPFLVVQMGESQLAQENQWVQGQDTVGTNTAAGRRKGLLEKVVAAQNVFCLSHSFNLMYFFSCAPSVNNNNHQLPGSQRCRKSGL